LYDSWPCPWAHRAAILRKLKSLENAASLAIGDSFLGDDGWAFYDKRGIVPDTVNGARYLREAYQRADPN
jgi:putative glutathione S-transferase